MKILWYADIEGSQKDVERLTRLMQEITKEEGGMIEGPYFPQGASLLYIFSVPEYDWLNRAGRKWFPAVQEAGLQVTPLRYEIAVTPDEFWGREGSAQAALF